MFKRRSTTEQSPAKQPSFMDETRGITDVAKQIGLQIPPISVPGMIYGFGSAYIRYEGSSIEKTGVDQTTVDFFLNEAYPALQELEDKKDPLYKAMGNQVGRTMMAGAIGHHMPIAHFGMKFDGDTLSADGIETAMEDPETVLEFGIGVTGLARHADNIRRDAYHLVSIQRDERENVLLAGMAERIGGRTTFLHGGMVHALGNLIAQDDPIIADVVIASRVHMAGQELLDAMDLVKDLTIDGSLIIARGPNVDAGHRDISAFVGYDVVHEKIEADDSYVITDSKSYIDHNDVQATSFVAERVE